MPRNTSLLLRLLRPLLKLPKQTSVQATQIVAEEQKPLYDDRDQWRAYWQSKDQFWRREPEITVERQEYLAQRRAIVPDIEKGIYPFRGIKLNRADIEWLLATHENGRGPVDWSDQSQRSRVGLDLRGADLSLVDLQSLPLACLQGGLTVEEIRLSGASAELERVEVAAIKLIGANLKNAHLEQVRLNIARLDKAILSYSYLEHAELNGAYLANADFRLAHLEGANFHWSHLEEANFYKTHLENAHLQGAYLEEANFVKAHLAGADLTNVSFNVRTNLYGVSLRDDKHGIACLADAAWNGVNLALVDWTEVKMLGDEYQALQQRHDRKEKDKETWIYKYEQAIRANRQLAVALQSQGLNEDAVRFGYRAQVLQRKVLWMRREAGKWFFSMLLALLAGYGYRMWRILAAYLIVVSLCAVAYFVIGIYHAPHLTLLQAFLESITAFHGRVFYELFTPDTPQIWVTAFEAIAGLVIESVFIAMLTQRFFGK